MPKLTLWRGVNARHGKNYNFIDKNISRFMYASGTAVYVHLYSGVYDQTAANGAIMPGGILSIQDPLFLENRDRKYDPYIRELRGTYNVQDISFDMKQFGIFLTDDTLFIELHLNDMIAMCGRRINTGDVIELPHRRDDQMPNDAPAINAFFVVDEGSWATDGYGATWFQHIWRIKCSPMTASQEYADILNKQATDPFGLNDVGTLGSLMSTLANEQGINNSVVDAAVANFKYRNFETQQFWIMPGTELGKEYPWVFASDGIPPNGQPLSQGTTFPESPSLGDYFLRTDYSPSTLFRRVEHGWQIQEFDRRQQEWSAANRLLYEFINNNNNSEFSDGTIIPQKQGLSTAVSINKTYDGITLTQPAMADIIPAIGDIIDDGEADSASVSLFSVTGNIFSNSIVSGVSSAQSNFNVGAVNFDGLTNNLYTPNLNAGTDTQNIACSFWVRLNSNQQNDISFIFGNASQSIQEGLFIFDYNNDSLVTYVENAAVGYDYIISNTISLIDGNWHHVFLATDSSNNVIYVDGIIANIIDMQNSASSYFNISLTGPAIFGNFSGDISEFWLTNETSFLNNGFVDNSTIDLFRDPNLNIPVFIGIDGSIPTGNAPPIYFHIDYQENPQYFANNFGSGGSFVNNGIVNIANSSPSLL